MRERVIWPAVGVAAAAVVVAIAVSGVYATATVHADDAGARTECGTVWDPNAVTSSCASALQRRSWQSFAALGLAVFAAGSAVISVGRPSGARRRGVVGLAVAVAVLTFGAALFRHGVIERTFGS